MILHIKNMVCGRCIVVVRQILESQQLNASSVDLGTAEIHCAPTEKQLKQLSAALKALGLGLIEKEKDKMTERIKNVIIELVHNSDLRDHPKGLTPVIAERLHKDYAYLSRLFSEVEDITIEKFVIQQKIEKVKELLQHGQLNLNEIAWEMGYSSSAHLSGQFKALTGISPRQFKTFKASVRNPIDKT